jgi:riboflavin synthase
MFTGIVEEIGIIAGKKKKGDGLRLLISAPKSAYELEVNDSVAINGVCQTVISKKGTIFEVEAVEETLKKTTFASLKIDNLVNLELPMKLNDRLGGHLVLGHVDCVGTITNIDKRVNSWIYSVRVPERFLRYTIPIGSIAIDGVSLTIAEMNESDVNVSIIPHTMENTIFKLYKVGSAVNLEFDVIGKYIERMHTTILHSKNKLSETGLRESGY